MQGDSMNRQLIHLFIVMLASVVISLPAQAQATHKKTTEETSSDIPKLAEFHEVIYPMWHQAYPQKDYGLLKELAPKVSQFARELPSIELPGILRDKKAKWDDKVRGLIQAASDYESAVGKNDNAKLLEAAEKVHAEYEGLVRVIRPVSKELEAYHVVLYKIYHQYLPGMKWNELRASSVELVSHCGDLLKAPLSTRLESKIPSYEKARAELCSATDHLAEITRGIDQEAIKKAVDDVHSKYQSVEKVFD
jgi:hypothetical protein